MLKNVFDIKTIFKKLKSEEGFSLVEMMVVVAVIMVVITNLVPSAQAYIRKAYKISDIQEGRMIGQTAQLLLIQDEVAYDSWMASYRTSKNLSRQPNFNGDSGVRQPFQYIEDDFSITPLCTMYRTHNNGTREERRFYNCVGNADLSRTVYSRFANILHAEMPLVDIQKRANHSQYLEANFGCRKKNQWGTYIPTTSTAHTGYLYGDSYVITARPDDPMYVEVYISCSNAASASYPLYRVYPDISTTYLGLQ